MSAERAVHELRAQAPAPLGVGRAGAIALALCVFAFAVALAAAGVSSNVGSPPTGSFSPVELVALSVLGALAVLGLVALVWSRPWEELARRERLPLWKRLLNLVVLTAVLAGALSLITALPKNPFGHNSSAAARRHHAAATAGARPRHVNGALDKSWVRGTAFAVGAAAGIVALFLLFRHPARQQPHEHADEQLDRAIAAGIEGLESELDPRRGVIRAYAGMERALADDGLPRGASETPLEYLRRALERLHASKPATATLTRLFEEARFSSHVIDEPMRAEALAALTDLRSELAR
jgi:hypothetical protein